ncbi:MAG: 50S ribosomal protein L3 [Parachlamydiaceae bacterium]|nr:50S ribosomal protein L3 [Parachlamydiaceae bacterium]
MGKKRGMMQVFDEQGNVTVCTVIEAEPNVVTQVKTKEKDGYTAIQLGFEIVKTKDPRTVTRRVGKPLAGHFAKAGAAPRRYITEARLDNVDGYTLGQEIALDAFNEVGFIDATAMSKGKGYQGVMKKNNYRGGPASHGSSFHRHAGSTGMRSTPGRCLPGVPHASQMGDDRVTVQNIRVVAVHLDDNVILLEGQVPGPRGGLVYLSPAKKKKAAKKK